MKGKGIFLLFSLLILFASCSHKINPEKPFLSATNFKLDSLPNSEIDLPVQISLKPFYSLAEKNVDTVFTSPHYPDDWVQEGCATRYKYTFRRGPLQIKASGNTFTLAFTGYYKIIGATRVCLNGISVSPWTPPCECGFSEGERKVNVSFISSFSVSPDYKIKLTIKRPEPQPLNKCEVCFWGQDITPEVMKGLKEQLDSAKADIERSYGIFDLRPEFQQMWDVLNKVYFVYDQGWLQINPQNIRINNLFARNDSLNIRLGLSAKPVMSFEKPVQQNLLLPDLSNFNPQLGFNIFLDAVLNYDSLSNILNQQVAGKQVDLDKGPVKKKFIVKNCSLIGEGNEKLIIRAEFSGSAEGVAYLIGKPVYDAKAHILYMNDLDFDVKTKDKFLRTAKWLFNKKILNEIGKYTRFDLTTYLDSAKINLNNQLNREWIKGIQSIGNIDDINLVAIYPLNDFLVIRSNCSGNLFVKVGSMNFGF